MNFRELLLEMPKSIGSADNTNIAKEFSKQMKKYILDINPEKKLFDNYMYSIKENVLD